MRIKRWIRPSKLIPVGAAIAIGLFLSIASHAFEWSEGSTFAVACALVAMLALFGPALFLVRDEGGQTEPRLARLPADVDVLKDQIGHVTGPTALYFPQTYMDKSFNRYRYLSGFDYRIPIHLNRVEESAYQVAAGHLEPVSRELTPADIEFDLGNFVTLARKQEKSVDLTNAGVFGGPEDAVLAGQHG
jgi:hypothetical protein